MEAILSLIVPVVLVLLCLKLFTSSVKLVWKIVINSASGFVCLWLLNLLSGITGFIFEINFVTCLVVGFLGIPGIVLMVLFQIMG